MIVLVGDSIQCYDDPVLLFCHQIMYITRSISHFKVISLTHSSIKQYLISIDQELAQQGDYLAGKLGPLYLQKIMWQAQGLKLGPTWASNIQRWLDSTNNINNNGNNGQLSRCSSISSLPQIPTIEKEHYLIPLMNTTDSNTNRLIKTWITLQHIKEYFKLPRELNVVPFKKITKVLRGCIKYGKVNHGCYLGMMDIYWIFDHLLLNDDQYNQLKSLIDELYESDIFFPFEQISQILVDYEYAILKLKTSRFLKDSLPNSDFARYCLLVKNHIFTTIPKSRKDINLFWREVWGHWRLLTPDERNRKMLNSLGAIRSWADDEEMKLFIGSSESDEEVVQWNSVNENDGVAYEDDDENDDGDDGDDDTDDDSYWVGWKKNINPSHSELALIKEVDDETICDSSITLIKPNEINFTDDEEVRSFNNNNDNDNNDITSTPLTNSNEFSNHIDQNDDQMSDSTKDTDLSLIKTNSLDFSKPGVLTALLDSPSSCGSSIRDHQFSDDEIILNINHPHPHQHREELSLPEKIDKYEKLSGIIRPNRVFSIPRKSSPSSPLGLDSSFEGIEYEHDFNSIDLKPTKSKDELQSLKTTLRPVMKKASTSTVVELKRLVDLRPVVASTTPISLSPTTSSISIMNNGNNTSVKLDLKKDISKMSISSIFAALLDDNMRDLATSAEYRNKIVHPEDLYNRIKISTDKPWDQLSRKTKERYYSAFLRRYSNKLDHPEEFMHVKTSKDKDALEAEDVVELVRVCASFDDWKRPIIKYAIQLVESVVSSRDNSEIDD